MTASWCRAALWNLRGELSTGRLVGWTSCQKRVAGLLTRLRVDGGIGWRSLDHLSFAQDADERIQLVSLHASRASVLIIMANSETEMILTPRWYAVAQVAQLLNYGESKVRMLIITGQLRSIKDGRSRRILPEWVEAYVQDRAKSTEDIW
jgi:excisionase family DNA binding protein